VDLFDKVKKGISDAGAKAKEMVDVTRLNNQIGQKQKEIEELYIKIGQAAFQAMQDSTLSEIEASIKDFSQEIIQKQQEITELERNIAEIKSIESKSAESKNADVQGQVVCPCGQVVTPETKFCPACGHKF